MALEHGQPSFNLAKRLRTIKAPPGGMRTIMLALLLTLGRSLLGRDAVTCSSPFSSRGALRSLTRRAAGMLYMLWNARFTRDASTHLACEALGWRAPSFFSRRTSAAVACRDGRHMLTGGCPLMIVQAAVHAVIASC